MHEPSIRIALVLPGAVSLGAYEAGALSALLRVVRASGGSLVVDTIVGASAGSVTGLLFAHALLAGPRADETLHELWVEQASMAALLRRRRPHGRARGPLSTERLERWAEEVLDVAGDPKAPPIAFLATIANLRGLRYRIAQPGGRVVTADTFRDAQVSLLQTPADCLRAVPAAIASAANPFAFPPLLLRRRLDEFQPNVQLTEDEASQGFWYTDGGTVYNMPLGFALQAVYNPDELRLHRDPLSGPRMLVVVHPHPAAPPAQWPPGEPVPNFAQTGIRALNMSREQSMFDDLRGVEKTNSRLRARNAMRQKLAELLETETGHALTSALGQLSAAQIERKARIRSLVHGFVEDDVRASLAAERAPDNPLAQIDRLLDELAGTKGKGMADVHVVSPDIDPLGRHPADLLAGERLGHFFGFIDRAARESDFGLGYHHLRLWWETLAKIADPEMAPLVPVVEVPAHPLEHSGDARGSRGPRDLPLARSVWLGIRLGLRYFTEAVAYLRTFTTRRTSGRRARE